MSNCREISMGKIVFESVDTFITRNVSSFRDRDYYREMEKEITKDVESLRERRTERGRRRKLHFHRGYPLLRCREYAYRARPRNCFSATIHAARTNIRTSRTYRIFPPVPISILRQILKNLSLFFFPKNPNLSIWIQTPERRTLTRRKVFFDTRNSLLKLLICKRLINFFFFFVEWKLALSL